MKTLANRKYLQQMTVGIMKVNTATSAAKINVQIFRRIWPTTVWDSFVLDLPKNLIKFLFTHFERIMMRFKFGQIVKIHCQGVVHRDRGEVPQFAFIGQAKESSEELG